MKDRSEDFFTVNLHTHTFRCKHASGTVADYCQNAIRNGIKILGFSDHCPFPDGEYKSSRMDFSELTGYIREIDQARADFPDLTILSGLEIDYLDKYGSSYYRDEFLEKAGLDYLIGGVHFICDSLTGERIWKPTLPFREETIILYLIQATSLMETGVIEYFAHPDLLTELAPDWTPNLESMYRDIIQTASDLCLPLEVNANGIRKGLLDTDQGPRWKYPNPNFWDLVVKYAPEIKIVVGSDAHHPGDIVDSCSDCLDFIASIGLKACNREIAENIIRRKKIKKDSSV